MISPLSNLSTSTIKKLEKIGITPTLDTKESIHRLFENSGVPTFDPVIEAFLMFGGYTLPNRDEGRFKIAQAKKALRVFRAWIKLDSSSTGNPSLFRMPFGHSETIQCVYCMDEEGHVYEDNKRIADLMAQWIEEWARNYGP